jgi:hypothetical protein
VGGGVWGGTELDEKIAKKKEEEASSALLDGPLSGLPAFKPPSASVEAAPAESADAEWTKDGARRAGDEGVCGCCATHFWIEWVHHDSAARPCQIQWTPVQIRTSLQRPLESCP